MQRVVDACVVAKWFLPEAYKEQADKLLHDDTVDLIAPDLLVIEFASLLWKRSTKIKDISLDQADQIWEAFLALDLPLHPSADIATAALKLATQNDHKIYDMLYIALAERNACEFVTADKTLMNKLGRVFPRLRWLGDL